MNREDYAAHLKSKMIEKFINEVNEMDADDVIDRSRVCDKCFQVVVNEQDYRSIVIEGTSPSEIELISGMKDHQCRIDDDSYDEDEEDDEEDNDSDDLILDLFQDAMDMLNTEKNPHLILTYMYLPQDGENNMTGQSVVYGSKKLIDFMLNDINDQINKNVDEDGHISSGNI